MHIIDDKNIDIYSRPHYYIIGSEMEENKELIYKFKDGYGFYGTPYNGTYTRTDNVLNVVLEIPVQYLQYHDTETVNCLFTIDDNNSIKDSGYTGGYLPWYSLEPWFKYDINKTY